MAKGGKGGDGGAAAARAEEAARQERIRQGTERVNSIFDGQFNDDFFNSRQQSFLDYATPQLNDQYGKAQKELAFALDRAGLRDSSVRAQREAELQQLYDTNRRSVADQGLSYSTQAKGNIEDARASLISQLNATGDAEGAANSALARSQALSAPDVYSPLADLFTKFTAGLGSQYAAEQARALSSSGYSTGGTGLFGTKKNSVTTTN